MHQRDFIFYVVSFFSLLIASTATAQYPTFVRVDNVESRYIDGELRFCPRENLRGIICGQKVRLFGKERFIVQDWWSPAAYVGAHLSQHSTQVIYFEILGVSPTVPGEGLVIFFQVVK